MSQESEMDDEMLPEYDFSDAVQGKHHRLLQDGYTITIHHPDGTKTIEQIKPNQDVIVLEPDVLAYFPDSASVNQALRGLIALLPKEKHG